MIGNFAPPVLKAGIDLRSSTPHISNKTVPLLTFAAQYATAPLPLPILTSVGFFVIGRFGKILIQIFPLRLVFRTIACLADSICRAVIVPDSAAFKPSVPNFNVFDLYSNFESFPFRIFLYFSFFGCKNIF